MNVRSLFVFAIIWASAAHAASRPNIIVILSDDAGPRMLPSYAAMNGVDTPFIAPNLDQLAARSVVARQAYASNTVCGPSRVGLLTGTYAQRLGLEHNIGQDATQPWGYAPGQQLISSRMKDLGYTTGMVGKWHGGYRQGSRPNDMGFDEFFGFLSGSRSYYADGQPHNAMIRNTTNVEGAWRTQGNRSLYDPVMGRYLTDAFSEESVDFINRHAVDDQPFFLYTSYTAPHIPEMAKSADLALFSGVSDPSVRNFAAMNYAMDRGIGMMMDALDAKGIRDNTIVFYLNDNGGGIEPENNPFRGVKGLMFEGGIRTPMLISGPGYTPGVYDQPVSMYDILPTAVAAGGGWADPSEVIGVDLAPYLSGAQAGSPHEVFHWRYEQAWAVRKGDWKLSRPNQGLNTPMFLSDLANDPAETTNFFSQDPEVVADLLRELTKWEATLRKPAYGFTGILPRNDFDHFVFRNDLNLANWSAQEVWFKAGDSATPRTLLQDDGYANAIFEFTTRNNANYAANNPMTRLSGQTYMLNELRLTGVFNSSVTRTASLNGNPLLFVKNLSGGGPKLRLDATAAPGSASFLFTITEHLQLLDDLEITGNGTQVFAINGVIRDYDEPRGVTKSGTSEVTFNARHTYKGPTIVEQGTIKFSNVNSGLDGTGRITVQNGGRIRLERGLINTDIIEIQPGGQFQFFGGRVQTGHVEGNLANLGGIFSGPDDLPSPISVSGNYSQNVNSKFEVRLGDLNGARYYDAITASGTVALAGSLDVKFVDLGGGLMEPNGFDGFELVQAFGGITGTFANVALPSTGNPNLEWSLIYEPTRVTLRIVALPGGVFTPENGIDADDLTVLKINFGKTNATLSDGDVNGDGIVDGFDILYWQQQFSGLIVNPRGIGAIPEPSSVALLAMGIAVAARRRTSRRLAS